MLTTGVSLFRVGVPQPCHVRTRLASNRRSARLQLCEQAIASLATRKASSAHRRSHVQAHASAARTTSSSVGRSAPQLQQGFVNPAVLAEISGPSGHSHLGHQGNTLRSSSPGASATARAKLAASCIAPRANAPPSAYAKRHARRGPARAGSIDRTQLTQYGTPPSKCNPKFPRTPSALAAAFTDRTSAQTPVQLGASAL